MTAPAPRPSDTPIADRAAASRARIVLLGAAGLGAVALAGCASETPADTTARYTDGEYTAAGEYQAPSGSESIQVTVTLEDDVVTDVAVVAEATDPTAHGFQTQFAEGVAEQVVGRDIDTLDVDRVAGSSLTSGGFEAAIATIKTEALED